MDSKYAKVFGAFNTVVYDEKYSELLSFLLEEFGEKKTIRTVKDMQNKVYDWALRQKVFSELPEELWDDTEVDEEHELNSDELALTFPKIKLSKKEKTQLVVDLGLFLERFEKSDFINIAGKIIESLQPELFSNFAQNLSHIKKSQERGTRWLIYYYYMNRGKKSGRFSIPLTKLENGLKDFKKVKNYQKLVEKLVLDCEEVLDIKFHKKTKSISLDPDLNHDDFLPLLSGFEEFNRAKAGNLEQAIINLVEYQPFANKEIVNLTGADKGHVSKVMKKLNAEGKIIPIGRAGNFQYWLTNCDNCPFNKDKLECWDETEQSITKIFKDKLDVELDADNFENVDNHILRNLNLRLQSETIRGYVAFSNRNSPSDNAYLEFYDSIFNTVLNSMKSKNPKEKLQMLSKTMPRLYSMGFSHALKESRKFEAGKILELMEKVGISSGHIDKFTDEYIEHVDKIDYK